MTNSRKTAQKNNKIMARFVYSVLSLLALLALLALGFVPLREPLVCRRVLDLEPGHGVERQHEKPRGKRLHTGYQHLRNLRGFSVAFSNGSSVARSNGISLSVVCSEGLSLVQQSCTGSFQWISSGIFQWNFTFVLSGVKCFALKTARSGQFRRTA